MESPARTTVFFDGACPVCAREMAVYRRAAGAEALCFVDVSREAPPNGLPREAALARLHVRRADGGVVTGAAAFAALWQALPRWRWLGQFAARPLVLPVLDLAYAGFLRLRKLWRRT